MGECKEVRFRGPTLRTEHRDTAHRDTAHRDTETHNRTERQRTVVEKDWVLWGIYQMRLFLNVHQPKLLSDVLV